MDANQIRKTLNQIFVDILDNNTIVLQMDTTAVDIDEWDSITHVQLIFAIEKHFRIKFTSTEIRKLSQIGDLVDSIKQKI